MVVELRSKSELAAAKELVERSDLSFEAGFDEMFGAFANGELVAVGARAGNVLKMLAIAEAEQGGSLLGEIVSALLAAANAAGEDSVFVYTKSEYASSFEALNFTLLANQGRVVLLEYGRGLKNWLRGSAGLRRDGVNGAVVVNCNPFTYGHRHLIETAARLVEHLYVFVVREDVSVFPFADRLRLVVDGVRDLANVTVLDTSRYLVSAATFPTYFLKHDDAVARIQIELDIALFSSRIAPFFGISRRFAGSEPCCPLTNAYNEAMGRLLPGYGIGFIVIPRKAADGNVISASRVREALAKGQWAEIERLVPPTTLAFLQSDAAAPVLEKLRVQAKF